VCARQDELFAGLKCQPGFVCSRPELSEDLRTLLSCVRCRPADRSCVLQCSRRQPFGLLVCLFADWAPTTQLAVCCNRRSGLFHNVDARVIPGKKGKCQLMFIFKQKIWPEMTSFDVTGSTMVPPDQVAKVMGNHKGGPTTVQTLADIKNVIEGWCARSSHLSTAYLQRDTKRAVIA